MAAPNVPNIASGNTVFSQEMRAFHQWEANELWTAVSAFFDGRLISTTGTSTTSNTIGTGDKTFTTQSGLGYVAGMPVNVVNTENPANYMSGFVKSYSGSTLVVTVITSGGSGTLTAWSIALGLSGGGATLGSNSFTGAQNFAQGTDIVAATTTNLETATGNSVVITGNTGISAWTLSNGRLRYGVITGTPLLTYHASNNNMNTGAANYQCVGGERFIAYAAGGVVYITLTKTDGTAINAATTKSALNTQITDGDVVFVGEQITLDTVQATTSGTSKSFTVPSWAKRVNVHFNGVSTNGTSNLVIQLNSETTNYLGTCQIQASPVNHSSAFIVYNSVAASAVMHGTAILNIMDATNNIWVLQGGLSKSASAQASHFSGIKALSSALTTVVIKAANGTDAFNLGGVNCTYE